MVESWGGVGGGVVVLLLEGRRSEVRNLFVGGSAELFPEVEQVS